MKKKIAAVLASVLALSMSFPASAHYLIAERGTINNPEVTVERTEEEIIKLATEDHILDTITENGLDLKEAVEVEDFSAMLWDFYRRPSANGVVSINTYDADHYGVMPVKWAAGKCIIEKSQDPKAKLSAEDIYKYLSAAGLDISAVSKIPDNPTRYDAVKAIIEALYNEPVLDYDRTGIMDTQDNNHNDDHHHHHHPYPPMPPAPPIPM